MTPEDDMDTDIIYPSINPSPHLPTLLHPFLANLLIERYCKGVVEARGGPNGVKGSLNVFLIKIY